jgi:hypothetical protein
MATERPENVPVEEKVWPEQVIGGKYVRLLEKQLQQLRGDEEHGNRQLFLDDVFVVYLLAFFTPSIRSLRTIEDFSQTKQAKKHLSVSKISKSTLSDFNQLADPQRLEPIIQALRGQLSRKQTSSPHADPGLAALLKQTVAVDGTFLPAVAEVAWAIANSNKHGTTRYRARVDTHLNVSTWLPEVLVVPEPGQSEANSAKEHLQADRIYVYDRGYMSFELLNAHYEPGPLEPALRSHFIVRFKPEGSNSPTLRDATEQPLTEEDRAAGIISDRWGYFVSDNACRAGISKIKLREVVIQYEEHGEAKALRLITNLGTVSAQTVGLLYRQRWQVELFFRWFKSFGHFGHLISHQREAVQMHLYVTIIAVLLMYLHTGYRPSKYMFAMVSQVAMGMATMEEILPILRERERQCELARQSAARRRAKKNAQRS